MPHTTTFVSFGFRRNFGKAAALQAGFAEAQGDVIVTIDGDLQDDPAEIPRLLAKLDEGFDLVSGWKTKRRDPLTRRIPSRIFNVVTGRLSGLRLHDLNCGLKAYRAEVVRGMPVYGSSIASFRCSRTTAAIASRSCR
jgi:glycosyltransferase involved in cell wall biosynthesis